MAFDIGSLDGIAAPIAVACRNSFEIEFQFRFVDGQDTNFRRELSRGKEGRSGEVRQFPEALSFCFPAFETGRSLQRTEAEGMGLEADLGGVAAFCDRMICQRRVVDVGGHGGSEDQSCKL